MSVVYVFALLLSGIAFGMENKLDFNNLFGRYALDFISMIEEKHEIFELAVPEIKARAKQEEALNKILNDGDCTKKLLHFFDDYCVKNRLHIDDISDRSV